MRLLFKLLMRMGFMQLGPSVSSITSATQAEGTSLVHTVTLASAVSIIPAQYPFSLGGGSASTPSDYTATPTFSNSVTLNGNTLTVPVGVSSFTITVATSQDTVYEGSETYTIAVGGMSNTGTITDDESAPTVTSVSSASATEAAAIVHTVTITGTAQAAQSYALTLSGGTATGGGTDYTSSLTNAAFSNGVTISGGTITVPAGVTSFTVSVPTSSDALVEGSETYTMSIGGASGTGTIIDEDAPAVAFSLVLSNPVGATISDGTGTATVTGGGGGGGAITVDVQAARTTGVAPLAVHFDATGSTSTQTSYPFHDCQYGWDFGDTGAGTWTYGARAGVASKNAALGPVTSHLFETAGTYTVTCAAFDGVSTATTTKTITVTAADTQWAGTKTICVATDGVFTGAPAGCVQVTSSNAVTAISGNIGSGDVRILFKRGQTFTVGSAIVIAQPGPGYIGAWGSGAKPILNLTTSSSVIQLSSSGSPTMSDWRFVDLDLPGNDTDTAAFSGSGSCSNVTIARCDMHNLKFGVSLSVSNLNGLNSGSFTHPCWSKFYIADNTVNDLVGVANGSNGMYLSLERSAVMGNYINPNNKGEHGIRAAYESYCAISHNEVTGIPSGRAFLTLRSPDQGSSTFPTGTYGANVYSEKNYVSDNKTYGGFTTGMNGIGPTNGTSTGRSRDFIWENNWAIGSATTTECFSFSGVNVTARNNLISMTGGNAFGTQPLANSPVPDNLWIYNNTIYASGSSAGLFSVIQNETGDMSASVFGIKNNIFYAPNTSNGTGIITNLVGATVNVGGTSNSGSSERTTNPNFTTTPPTTTAHFKPAVGSYAIGRGVAVPVWKDFAGVSLSGTRDMGAVKS